MDHWSAYAKNGGVAHGHIATPSSTPQHALENLIAKTFGNSPFIYTANKDWRGDELFPNGLRLPLVMHGKNEFEGFQNVAFMPSTLPVPDKWRFLRWLGLTDEDIRDEYYHSHAYQTVFRSAARVAGGGGEVTAIVPGRAACQYIQRKAPAAKIIEHEVLLPRRGVGRPSAGRTKAEVKAVNKVRMWLKRNPGKPIEQYVPRG
jgi:hypothetical protein